MTKGYSISRFLFRETRLKLVDLSRLDSILDWKMEWYSGPTT